MIRIAIGFVLSFVIGAGCRRDIDYLMSNNFACGGINTSLIFRRV